MKCKNCKNYIKKGKEAYFQANVVCQRCFERLTKRWRIPSIIRPPGYLA